VSKAPFAAVRKRVEAVMLIIADAFENDMISFLVVDRAKNVEVYPSKRARTLWIFYVIALFFPYGLRKCRQILNSVVEQAFNDDVRQALIPISEIGVIQEKWRGQQLFHPAPLPRVEKVHFNDRLRLRTIYSPSFSSISMWPHAETLTSPAG
jgi:hypothetical protein